MRHRLIVGCVLALALVAGACGGDSDEVGTAGDATKASRTIEIRALDSRRFDPASVTVRPGETVTLRLTNTGTKLHELLLGNEKTHDDHEKEMAAMGDAEMKMSDEANRIFVEPGETKQLTWTFPSEGEVIFGCHMPGDYSAGMRGTVSVSD